MRPNDPYLAVVFEFYSNFLDPKQETVVVRSKEVEITAAAINEFYGLQSFDDEYIPFVENITDEKFDQVLYVICVEGTRWNISRTGKWSCRRTALTPQARVRYHLLRTRLMSTTHDQMVSQDRFILLYCILTGKSTDVGKCIEVELRFSAFTKNEGKLFFPSLISGLCLKADILYNDAETKVQNSAKISTVAITRLSKPPSGSSSLGFEQAMSDINRCLDLQEHNQLQLKQMLQHMERQKHEVWKYIKEKV